MSTLSVATIKSADSDPSNFHNSSGTEVGQLIRAWVHFDGYNNQVDASFNISSVTDVGTGHYKFNFTTAFVDANYSWTGTGSTAGTTRDTMRLIGFMATDSTVSNNAQLAASTSVKTELSTNNQLYDTDHVMIQWAR